MSGSNAAAGQAFAAGRHPATAMLRLDGLAQAIEVKVWDVWDEGAGLELPFDIALPGHFELVFEPSKIKAKVKIKLQTGRLVRVAFTDLAQP